MNCLWLTTLGLLYLCLMDGVFGCMPRRCPRRKKNNKPRRMRACDGDLPCYDFTLNLIIDGPLRQVSANSEYPIIQAYRIINPDNGRSFALSEGRKAVEFFKSRYGFDFSDLTDKKILSGITVNSLGLLFKSFRITDESRFRLYSATAFDKVQLFNRPIIFVGWQIVATQPILAGGTYQKMIPANGVISYGAYIWHPCDDYDYECENILNPSDPGAPMYVFFKAVDFITSHTEPNMYSDIHNDIWSPFFGVGKTRGYIVSRDENDPSSEFRDANFALIFPSNQ